MDIAGIQKLTLVDFPGRVAATIFTRGCSFRCPFCHNPELVIPEEYSSLLDEKQLFEFLEKRYGKLTGVCITGGEPCMQKDIDKFISHMKALGFDVKLDTNGSFPEKLEKIIRDGDIDYIAMDIKNSLKKYFQTVSVSNNQFPISSKSSIFKKQISNEKPACHSERSEESQKSVSDGEKISKNIKKSIDLIKNSGIPYEFRTTVCHPLHSIEDFHEIGKMIEGAPLYYIQNFVYSKHIDEKMKFKPFTDDELTKAREIMLKYVKEVQIR